MQKLPKSIKNSSKIEARVRAHLVLSLEPRAKGPQGRERDQSQNPKLENLNLGELCRHSLACRSTANGIEARKNEESRKLLRTLKTDCIAFSVSDCGAWVSFLFARSAWPLNLHETEWRHGRGTRDGRGAKVGKSWSRNTIN